MKHHFAKIKEENGSVMVIALLMLAFLTLIGMSAATNSSNEIMMAGNDKFHKIAFYNADSGIYVAPKMISLCVDNGEPDENPTNIAYLDSNGDPDASDTTLDDIFFYEIMGYDELLGRDSHDSASDMRFVVGGHNVAVDIERSGQQSMAGGGVEFASGAEGVGSGSSGGVALLYTMDSLGNGPSSSLSNIGAVYRKVVGVAGGL